MKAETKWNLFKPGGWEAYKEVSDSFADDINRIVDDERVTVDEMIGKIDKIQEKVNSKHLEKLHLKGRAKQEEILLQIGRLVIMMILKSC